MVGACLTWSTRLCFQCSCIDHCYAVFQDQAISPVLQQYIMHQKHHQLHTSPAVPRAPARAPDSNRPRMSNAMARHLGIIPGKDQRNRLSGTRNAAPTILRGARARGGGQPHTKTRSLPKQLQQVQASGCRPCSSLIVLKCCPDSIYRSSHKVVLPSASADRSWYSSECARILTGHAFAWSVKCQHRHGLTYSSKFSSSSRL